ncbi:MAG: hypothetical protein QM648_07040 [Solirubrobacterales bacterium]
MDFPEDRAREREEEERIAEREPSVIELMNGPARPDARRRRTVLWIGLAFAMLMLALTVAVISMYGLDFLTLFTAATMIVIVAAMIGALRYKGEDPMAQFDPPDRAAARPFWRRAK